VRCLGEVTTRRCRYSSAPTPFVVEEMKLADSTPKTLAALRPYYAAAASGPRREYKHIRLDLSVIRDRGIQDGMDRPRVALPY